MLKKNCIIILLIITISMLVSCSNKDLNSPFEKSLFAMDTYITMTSYGKNSENALGLAENKIIEMENLWSTTNENSEIYKINHSNGQPVKISQETTNIIDFSLEISSKTDGALDITLYPILTAWGFTTENYQIPTDTQLNNLLKNTGNDKINLQDNTITLEKDTQIDLGAIGKGYTGDLILEILKDNGITSALINLGGNIQTLGSKPDGSPWKLGIRNPFDEGNFATLEVVNKSVITSGNYERYFIGEDGNTYWHILDSKTGKPAKSGLISVTIIGDEGKLCDALSTALFVMGLDKSVEFWKEYQNFDMILITENGKIFITNNIKDNFSLNDVFSNMKVNVIYP